MPARSHRSDMRLNTSRKHLLWHEASTSLCMIVCLKTMSDGRMVEGWSLVCNPRNSGGLTCSRDGCKGVSASGRLLQSCAGAASWTCNKKESGSLPPKIARMLPLGAQSMLQTDSNLHQHWPDQIECAAPHDHESLAAQNGKAIA